MVRITFDICLPSQSIMDESFSKSLANITGAPGTLQDIAYNIVQDRSNSSQPVDSGTKERTIFVLGSKGVVSVTSFLNLKEIKFVYVQFLFMFLSDSFPFIYNCANYFIAMTLF